MHFRNQHRSGNLPMPGFSIWIIILSQTDGSMNTINKPSIRPETWNHVFLTEMSIVGGLLPNLRALF